MELWVQKIMAFFVIFFVCLVCLLLPIPLHKKLHNNTRNGVRIISALMCFGGGTFLGVYMLHMAPESMYLINKSILVPYDITYPVCEVIIGLGFLMMLLVEITVLHCKNSKDKKESKIERQNSKSSTATDLSTNDLHNGDHPEIKDLHVEHVDIDLKSARSLLLLMALSMHHIFEGISVGLKSSTTQVWTLVIAVLCHESIISFSLGLQLMHANPNKCRVVVLGFICSLMTPVGVAIGLGITETGGISNANTVDMVNGILQAVSTGVFLYVTFFEILHGEVNHTEATYMKLFFICLGYGMMCLLSLMPEERGDGFIPTNMTLPLAGETI